MNSLRVILESEMSKATSRDIHDQELGPAISRLVHEMEYLEGTHRHQWLRRSIRSLHSTSNWPAFAMEVHLSYALEKSGYHVKNSICCINGNDSDIDIVYSHENIKVRIECVSMFEPEDFWTNEIELDDGTKFREALHDGKGEAFLLRKLQNKIRLKTIKNHSPIKFPPVDSTSLHVIIADVSQGAGFKLDRYDLHLMSWGHTYVFPLARRKVLGLFESSNLLGTKLDKELQSNRFLRERVHAIIYLVDESRWKGPFDPMYCGCIVDNKALNGDALIGIPRSDKQESALVALGRLLTKQKLVESWM